MRTACSQPQHLILVLLTEDPLKQEFFDIQMPSHVLVECVRNIEELIFQLRFKPSDIIVIDKEHSEANQPHLLHFIENLSDQTINFVDTSMIDQVFRPYDYTV